MGFGVIEKECEAFPVVLGTVGLDLFELRAAVPDFAYGDRAVEFH
jgi:hypothetical protein